ncbi:MAG: hypothetical protein E7330_04520 [Clostridiales bacterium]|nr:hypothetical protein [Clostridiales bacterium]
MRIWAAKRTVNKIIGDVVLSFDIRTKVEVDDWNPVIGALAEALNLARPVLLKKHIRDLEQFSHTAFLSSDFMEPIDFDKLTVEIFPDQDEKRN